MLLYYFPSTLQLAKIERYQTRLRLMAFMSTFDEMYGVVQPVSGPHCVSVCLMCFDNLSFWCLESGKCAQCIFGAVSEHKIEEGV